MNVCTASRENSCTGALMLRSALRQMQVHSAATWHGTSCMRKLHTVAPNNQPTRTSANAGGGGDQPEQGYDRTPNNAYACLVPMQRPYVSQLPPT